MQEGSFLNPPPPKPLDILPGSTWWRASAYEIVGGTHIAPVEGSEVLKYDPFKDRGEVAPYVELLRIDLDKPEELRRWVERFGLLGILPHQTVEAFFKPRWEERLISGVMSGSAVQQKQYRAGQPVETLAYEELSQANHESGVPVDPAELEHAVEKSRIFWKGIQPAGVRSVDPATDTLQRLDIAEGYAQFFPHVEGVCEYAHDLWRSKYAWITEPPDMGEDEFAALGEKLSQRDDYPAPLTDAFLLEYGEPLALMRNYVISLRNTVDYWSQVARTDSIEGLDYIVLSNEGHRVRFPPSFTAGVRAVHPTGIPWEDKKGKLHWKLGWDSRSLYGTLNTMVLQDFALRGARAKYCTRCGRLFVTKQYNKEYCSSKCRKASQMNRYRETLRAERRKIK